MNARARARHALSLVRALPDVASWRPLAVTAAVSAGFVFTASPGAAQARMRIGGALVAATCAFLLDDEAAATVAPMPTTLLRRRLPRLATAVMAVGLWWTAVAVGSDLRVGTGRPPAIVVVESAAIAMIGLAVAALVARRRGDTESGGVAGASVAIAVFAATFLPPRWWWPLAADPASVSGEQRIAANLLLAAALVLIASADRARRRSLL